MKVVKIVFLSIFFIGVALFFGFSLKFYLNKKHNYDELKEQNNFYKNEKCR